MACNGLNGFDSTKAIALGNSMADIRTPKGDLLGRCSLSGSVTDLRSFIEVHLQGGDANTWREFPQIELRAYDVHKRHAGELVLSISEGGPYLDPIYGSVFAIFSDYRYRELVPSPGRFYVQIKIGSATSGYLDVDVREMLVGFPPEE